MRPVIQIASAYNKKELKALLEARKFISETEIVNGKERFTKRAMELIVEHHSTIAIDKKLRSTKSIKQLLTPKTKKTYESKKIHYRSKNVVS